MPKQPSKNAWGRAALVLAATVLVSTLYGSHRSLTALYQQTQVVFTQGIARDGYSIQSDLERRLEVSGNLLTMAGKYLPQEELGQVEADRKALTAAKGPAEKYRANQALTQSTSLLLQRLETQSLSERDQRLRGGMLADLHSANEIIGHDPYNSVAQEYNQILSAFPANILRPLTGVPRAELFG